MLKKSIAVVVLAVVVFFIATLMGWVNIGGVSPQIAEVQPPVPAKHSQAVAHAGTNCAPQVQAAASKFIDGYIEFLNGIDAHTNRLTRDQWVKRNKIATTNFKSSYRELEDEANKSDPELGLDMDPILVAQDWPATGFVADGCDASGYVSLRGKSEGWADFKLVVKVIKTNSGWRVDGAGLINIPNDMLPHNK